MRNKLKQLYYFSRNRSNISSNISTSQHVESPMLHESSSLFSSGLHVSPIRKNVSIFSPGISPHSNLNQLEFGSSQLQPSELGSPNQINSKKDSLINNFNPSLHNSDSQRKEQEGIQENILNSMSSIQDLQNATNQKDKRCTDFLKELGNLLGEIPHIEQACGIKETELNQEKVSNFFSEMKMESIHLDSQSLKISPKLHLLDIINGKFKPDLNNFYEQEIKKSSPTIKKQTAFLCSFEVFKVLISNLLQNFLGSEGVQITFYLHLISAINLLACIFSLKILINQGNYVKLAIFGAYLFSMITQRIETSLYIIHYPDSYLISIQSIAQMIPFYIFFSFKFYTLFEKFMLFLVVMIAFLIQCYKFLEWNYCYYMIILHLICLYRAIIELELDFSSFLNTRNLDQKMNDQNKLLEYLLPHHIRDQFLQNQSKQINLIDNFDQVTILYADIAGFTKYSANVQPEQVFIMLRELFTKFDEKCQENSVYKLYTIGDCYVVMGLLNLKERDIVKEAMNVIQLGFDMIEIIKQVRSIIQFEELEMRIGIHTGSIIGGVVGTGVVRYDIYGPDVVIANKMESNGESGRIMISEDTLKTIQESSQNIFQFERETEVNVPAAKRIVKSYLVKQVGERFSEKEKESSNNEDDDSDDLEEKSSSQSQKPKEEEK